MTDMNDRILGGRYQLFQPPIGTGGMAIVYRALDRRTGHDVAVKILRPDLAQNAEYVNRFQREAQAASKMTHHNIVNLLDVGMDGENRYLVMEYVQGQTLKEVIKEKGRLPARAAVEITIRILSALQHAHENGIVHRDIKPQNILVNEEGHVKVADFGIARIADTQTITRSDTVMGSVHYFSPEQAKGDPSDVRSDLYSIGIVLYEMLTGRVPFDGDTQVSVAMQHLHGQPIPIAKLAPDVPPAVAHVCMVAMSKNPDNRYQSAREMATDLRMAMDGRMEVIQNHPLEPAAAAAIARRSAPPQPPESERKQGDGKGGTSDTGSGKRVRVNKTWWMITGVVVLLVIGILGYGIYRIIHPAGPAWTAADFTFTGMTYDEAAEKAKLVNVTLTRNLVSHSTVPEGTVISQMPEPENVWTGYTVTLTVSDGPDRTASASVPKVTGETRARAVEILRARGLSADVRRVLSTDAEGFVLSQNPAAYEPIPEDGTVYITVSGGSVPVPVVENNTFEGARAMLEGAQLKVSKHVDVATTADQQLVSTVAYQDTRNNQMIDTGIGLTVYVVRASLKSAEVPVVLPESESQLYVTVTLDITGNEVIAFDNTNAGGDLTLWENVAYGADAPREQTLTLSHWKGGTCVMRVYVNEARIYIDDDAQKPVIEQEVTLQ